MNDFSQVITTRETNIAILGMRMKLAIALEKQDLACWRIAKLARLNVTYGLARREFVDR